MKTPAMPPTLGPEVLSDTERGERKIILQELDRFCFGDPAASPAIPKPLSQLEILSAVAYHAREIVRLTATIPLGNEAPTVKSGEDDTPEHLLKQGYRSGKIADKS